jgi:GTP-binding protein HflX
LEEVSSSDLVLHVVDGSDVDPLGQLRAVREVLGEIDALHIPELVVVNKCDAAAADVIDLIRSREPDCVVVSALTGAGIAELRRAIEQRLPEPDVEIQVSVPYHRGDLLARIYREGAVLERSEQQEGTWVTARVPADLAAALEQA